MAHGQLRHKLHQTRHGPTVLRTVDRDGASDRPAQRRHGAFAANCVYSILRLEPAILATMPKTQNEDGRAVNLISKLVAAHDNPSNLARLKAFEFLAETWKIKQLFRGTCELLHHPGGRLGSYRPQMFMQAHKIR